MCEKIFHNRCKLMILNSSKSYLSMCFLLELTQKVISPTMILRDQHSRPFKVLLLLFDTGPTGESFNKLLNLHPIEHV